MADTHPGPAGDRPGRRQGETRGGLGGAVSALWMAQNWAVSILELARLEGLAWDCTGHAALATSVANRCSRSRTGSMARRRDERRRRFLSV